MKKFLFVFALLTLIVAVGITAVNFGSGGEALAEINAIPESNLYYIDSEADFMDFIESGRFSVHTYILLTDIYLDRLYDGGGKLGTRTDGAEFKGVLDGREHAIVGLKEPLFDTIGSSAVVKNLQLIGVAQKESGDNITASTKYALAKTNNGTISNVQVTGDVQGAGLVQTNNGSIDNVLAVINRASVVSGKESNIIAYDGTGTITNSYAYDLKNDLEEGTNSFFDTKDKVSYAVLNLALALDYSIRANHSINLYNTPFVAKDSWADGYIDDFLYHHSLEPYHSIRFFNYSSLPYEFEIEKFSYPRPLEGLSNVINEFPFTEGDGSKEHPYEISTPWQLVGLNLLGENEYAMLTADINLDLYYVIGSDAYYINDFKGHFSGNGKTITLANSLSELGDNVRLFWNISEGASISDLYLNGLLAGFNFGTISNVTGLGDVETFYYDTSNSFIRDNASTGVIIRTHAENYFGLVQVNVGQMFYCSSKNNVFVENNQGEIHDAYYEHTEDLSWIPSTYTNDFVTGLNINRGIAYDTVITPNPTYYYYTSDINLDTFPAVNLSNTMGDYLYSSAWAFGTEEGAVGNNYSWGYLTGTTLNNPVLVNPANRVEYKENMRFKEYYGTADYAYGRLNGYKKYNLDTLPAGTDTDLYTPFDDDNTSLYVDALGTINELLTSSSGSFSVENAEFIVKSGFSVDVKAYLEDKTFSWKRRAIGGEYSAFEGTTFDKSVYPSSEFYLYYHDDVAYIEALVTLTDTLTIEYNYIELGLGVNTLITSLDLRNALSNVFIDMGYAPNSSLLGYKGVELVIKDSLGAIVTPTDNLVPAVVGSYYEVMVTLPSTNNVSGTTLKCKFNVVEGTIDSSNSKIISSIGGLSEDTAPVYSGSNFELSSLLSLQNLSIATIDNIVIENLTRPSGDTIVGIDNICDAGVYSLRATVKIEGFEDAEREIIFYVKQKEVALFIKIDGKESLELDYYSELPTVSYHLEDESEITTLNGLGYSSEYTRGSSVKGEGEYYSAKFVAPADDTLNPNYIISALENKEVKIIVKPVKITIDEGGLADLEVVYSANEYSLVFDESKINRNTLETTPLDYTLVYECIGQVQYKPYTFKDAGNYTMGAWVRSDSKNYLTSEKVEATLTIKKNAVTVSAKDSYVNYGEDAVYLLDIKHTELTPNEDFEALITEGVHYEILSSYVKGETVAGEGVEIILQGISYDLSVAVKLINYDITWDSTPATLTIGKKVYALNMVDSYEYSGKGVVLDFNGEQFTFSEGYPKFKKQIGGEAKDFTGTPADACDSTFKYLVHIKIDESAEYYGTTNKTYYPTADANGVIVKEFVITPKEISLSGLYLFQGENRYALEDNMSYTYDGNDYRIDIDSNEFAGAQGLVYTYRYKLYSNDGDTFDYVSANPIILNNAIRIKEISLTIEGDTTLGAVNFVPWQSSEVITSFEIAPRKVALDVNELSILPYKGYEYPVEPYLSDRVNALPFVVGYAPISGDQITFKVELLEGGTSILNPGTYTLKVTSLNPNYIYDENATVYQTISSGNAQLNLERYSFDIYEYGTLNTASPYVIAKDFEFVIDSEDVLKADIKFFIDYNSTYQNGSIAPGTYNISRAESITGIVNGEVTDFIKFNVLNGDGKIVINPIEITFDYRNMISSGVGIKPTYVYGDEELKDLPYRVNKTMTRSISGAEYSDIPGIVVTVDKTVKHADTYNFSAKTTFQTLNDNGQMVDCFILSEEVRTYQMVVEKKEVLFEVATKEIIVGDSLPTSFSVRFPRPDKAPTQTEQQALAYTFNVAGFDNTTEGSYAVSVSALLNEGGSYFDDFTLVKITPDAKELVVRFLEFDSSLNVSNVNTAYTGMAILPDVENLPADARVTYSTSPINVGTYNLIVTVEMAKYRPKTFNAVVVITPAIPTIEFTGNKNFPFDVRHVLGHDDVYAYAHLNGVAVEGEFYFSKTNGLLDTEYLRYGEYEYVIGFNPASTNFAGVGGLRYKMTTYLEASDYSVTANGEPLAYTITAEEQVTFTLTTSERVKGVLHMLVNGENTYVSLTSNSYVITEDTENVLIDLMIHNVSVYSLTVNVVITGDDIEEPTPPVDPSEPSEPTEPSTPSNPNDGSGENGSVNQGGNQGGNGSATLAPDNGGKEEGNNLGLIIGLSVGGGVLLVAGVVVLVIFLTKKKGGKNE